MRLSLTLLPLTLFPLTAQVQGPQLGFAFHNGELRRVEGLSISSHLSEPLVLASNCSRLEIAPAMRWAICAAGGEQGAQLIDLQGLTVRSLEVASFERVVWSPNGELAVVDGSLFRNFDAKQWTREDAPANVSAVSDKGAFALRDEAGRISFAGSEAAGGNIPSAVAFDGEALLLAFEGSITRIEPDLSTKSYELAFAATSLRALGGAIYAGAARSLARIDTRLGNAAEYYELAFDATSFNLLAEGSLLLAQPVPGEPGWLFRWREGQGGQVSFIPGFPEAQKESDQQ